MLSLPLLERELDEREIGEHTESSLAGDAAFYHLAAGLPRCCLPSGLSFSLNCCLPRVFTCRRVRSNHAALVATPPVQRDTSLCFSFIVLLLALFFPARARYYKWALHCARMGFTPEQRHAQIGVRREEREREAMVLAGVVVTLFLRAQAGRGIACVAGCAWRPVFVVGFIFAKRSHRRHSTPIAPETSP